MWFKISVIVILFLGIVITLTLYFGENRWQADTRNLHAKLAGACVPHPVTIYDPGEIEGLPAPVRRYFQTTLRPGQPIISAAWVKHTGTFNMSETGEQWKPFESTQRIITRQPGFVWDARIFMAKKLAFHVHDAYVTGAGILRVKLFGLVPLVDMPSTPALAQGELMRFFAEAAWYPTALLPSQGIRWEAVDDSTARATLTVGGHPLTMQFTFDARNRIKTVRAENRARIIDGESVPTPWEGRFTNYGYRDNMLIPIDGEVAWILPDK